MNERPNAVDAPRAANRWMDQAEARIRELEARATDQTRRKREAQRLHEECRAALRECYERLGEWGDASPAFFRARSLLSKDN